MFSAPIEQQGEDSGSHPASSSSPRPILDLSLVKQEPSSYQPSPVLILSPPSWAKRFSGSIIAPVVDETWRAVQPTPKGVDDFIPLELNEEEKTTAAVEVTVMNMLTHIRGRVESLSKDDSDSISEEVSVATMEESDRESNRDYSAEEAEQPHSQESVEKQEATPKKNRSKHSESADLRDKISSKRDEGSSRKRKRSRSRSEDGSSHSSGHQSARCIELYDDQKELTQVTDDLKQMQENGLETDVDIKVGERIFKCHCSVLKRNKNSFGDLLERIDKSNKQYIIEIQNVKPETFEFILRYLYKSKVDLKSLEEANEVFDAAQIMNLSELVKVCTRFLIMQLTGREEDFWPSVDQVLKDQPEPFDLSFAQVRSFVSLLNSKDFLDVSLNTLKFVVHQQFIMHCTEMTLIEAVENWAKRHLKNSKIPIDYTSMRTILGPVVSKLRFLSLDQNQLVHLFKKTLLLNEKEKLELLEWSITNRGKPLLPEVFCTEKFSRDCNSAIRFFMPKFSPAKVLTVKEKSLNCSFFFTPRKDMYFISFEYFSQIPPTDKYRKMNYKERFSAQLLQIQGNKMHVLREVSSSESLGYDSIIKVSFDVPTLLRKNSHVCYAIKLSLQSSGLYHFKENNYLKIDLFERFFLEPLRSDFCWGNDGIFTSFQYKVL